jgi:hypothetical protein
MHVAHPSIRTILPHMQTGLVRPACAPSWLPVPTSCSAPSTASCPSCLMPPRGRPLSRVRQGLDCAKAVGRVVVCMLQRWWHWQGSCFMPLLHTRKAAGMPVTVRMPCKGVTFLTTHRPLPRNLPMMQGKRPPPAVASMRSTCCCKASRCQRSPWPCPRCAFLLLC